MARKVFECEGDFGWVGTSLSAEVMLKSLETLSLVKAPIEEYEVLGVGHELVVDRLEGACKLPNGL